MDSDASFQSECDSESVSKQQSDEAESDSSSKQISDDSDEFEESKLQRDDNSDEETNVLSDEQRTTLLMNLCEMMAMFEKDTHPHKQFDSLSAALKKAYITLCVISSIGLSPANIESIRAHQFTFRLNPDEISKWQRIRRNTVTTKMPSFVHSTVRPGHAFLVSPIKICPHCESDLGIKAISQMRCLTASGHIFVTELSYVCHSRKCSSKTTYHYDYKRDPNLGILHYRGDTRSEHYQTINSQYLGKDVWIPKYIRVSRQLWMSWTLFEHIKAVMSHGAISFKRAVEICRRTSWTMNLNTKNVNERLKDLTTPEYMVNYFSWWHLLRVRIYQQICDRMCHRIS